MKRAVGDHEPADQEIEDVAVDGGRRLRVRYEYGYCTGGPLAVRLRISGTVARRGRSV